MAKSTFDIDVELCRAFHRADEAGKKLILEQFHATLDRYCAKIDDK